MSSPSSHCKADSTWNIPMSVPLEPLMLGLQPASWTWGALLACDTKSLPTPRKVEIPEAHALDLPDLPGNLQAWSCHAVPTPTWTPSLSIPQNAGAKKGGPITHLSHGRRRWELQHSHTPSMILVRLQRTAFASRKPVEAVVCDTHETSSCRLPAHLPAATRAGQQPNSGSASRTSDS